MCGLVGWLDFDHDARARRDVLDAMNSTMRLRGPDAGGTFVSELVAIGHRRLAIVDIDGGAQPMVSYTEQREELAVVAFTGEIYNFRALRADLHNRGHRFRTSSDTEVLLASYLEWGVACVSRFAGMFAFAIWDVRNQELVLGRDRSGIKPLFYQELKSGVVFGSEPKALLAHPAVHPRVSIESAREIFDMVKTPGRTVFADIREVRPGTVRTWSASGEREYVYWMLQPSQHEDDYVTTVEKTRGILEQVVEEQASADVSVGTLLSGGLDSSLVTSMTARATQAGGQLASFALDFEDEGDFKADFVRGSTDAPFARELAQYAGTRHRSVPVDPASMLSAEMRDAVVRAADAPPAYWGDMWPSLYGLFNGVREDVTVALSGEGADELFGGYHWFHNPAAIDGSGFPWLTRGSSRYFGGLGLMDESFASELQLDEVRRSAYADARSSVLAAPGENAADYRMRVVSHLNLSRFMQTLLDRKDRMSMASGLEVRVPFCDHRLIEYVYNVPWAMKNSGGRVKGLLQDVAAGLVPQSIISRKKSPYPSTQDATYERGLRLELAEVLADPTSPVLAILDKDRARAAATRAVEGASLPYHRGSLELALGMNRWMRLSNIELV